MFLRSKPKPAPDFLAKLPQLGKDLFAHQIPLAF
jgi:hypothetical protein